MYTRTWFFNTRRSFHRARSIEKPTGINDFINDSEWFPFENFYLVRLYKRDVNIPYLTRIVDQTEGKIAHSRTCWEAGNNMKNRRKQLAHVPLNSQRDTRWIGMEPEISNLQSTSELQESSIFRLFNGIHNRKTLLAQYGWIIFLFGW